MKKFNKITSFMLAVCAVTSLMSVSASATTIPTKSNQDMKIINLSDSINENELNEIKNSVGAYLIYDGNMIELSDSILTIEDIATSEYRSANSNSYKLTLNADINEQEEKNSRKIVSDSGDKNSSNVNASATLQLIWTDNPGINNVIDLEYSEKYNDFANNFWKGWLHDNKFKLLKLLSKNKQYYSSNITRFYIDYKDKSGVGEYVKNLRRIWDNKDVVIVEGEYSRLGVGNDLFDNMKSIQRIICPSENAFEIYNKILNEILKVDKNKIIMLALGPAATVLAYDLYKAGYTAIDIGHVDIEYEWFLRKATEKIKIETKYVTEVKGGENNIQDVEDERYEKEIIARIMK